MIHYHRCAATLEDAHEFSIYQEENENWILAVNQVATESDLEENSHLDEVGDSIYQSEMEISFCPFCGEKLANTFKNRTYAVQFNDSSKWE